MRKRRVLRLPSCDTGGCVNTGDTRCDLTRFPLYHGSCGLVLSVLGALQTANLLVIDCMFLANPVDGFGNSCGEDC